jgi:hypothetical protein
MTQGAGALLLERTADGGIIRETLRQQRRNSGKQPTAKS